MSAWKDEECVRIQEMVSPLLFGLPGVHTIGLGGREKDGRPTGELVLKVCVSRKRSPRELCPSEVIPPRLLGLGTDVVECPPPREALSALPGVPASGRSLNDETKLRPLVGGLPIRGAARTGKGTLGFFLRDKTNLSKVYALTNHHVLFRHKNAQVPGLRVGQPNVKEGVSGCCKEAIGSFEKGHYDSLEETTNPTDVALIRLDAGIKWKTEIFGLTPILGTHTITTQEAAAGDYQVVKRGINTGASGGTVVSINSTSSPKFPRPYNQGILIRPNPGSTTLVKFSDEGDSGSAILNLQGEIVGLLFTTHFFDQPDQLGFGTAMQLHLILKKFLDSDQLDLEVAANLPGVQVVPSAAPAEALGPPVPAPLIDPRIEQDLDRTSGGRELVSLWLQHGPELQLLVNHKRRVTVAWHRNGGAALFQSAVRCVETGIPMPSMIGGRQTDERVDELIQLFFDNGSLPLRADIARHRRSLPQLGGRTYQQLLDDLQALDGTGAEGRGEAAP